MLFENRVAMSLISPFVGAISGAAVARGVSFLKEKLGQRVFAPGVTLSEDPWRLRGLGSAPFDDEGAPTAPRELVSAGRAHHLAAQRRQCAPAGAGDHRPR